MITQEEQTGGINFGFGFKRYTVLYIKQINNKDSGNYSQHCVITCNEKKSGTVCMYFICIYKYMLIFIMYNIL